MERAHYSYWECDLCTKYPYQFTSYFVIPICGDVWLWFYTWYLEYVPILYSLWYTILTALTGLICHLDKKLWQVWPFIASNSSDSSEIGHWALGRAHGFMLRKRDLLDGKYWSKGCSKLTSGIFVWSCMNIWSCNQTLTEQFLIPDDAEIFYLLIVTVLTQLYVSKWRSWLLICKWLSCLKLRSYAWKFLFDNINYKTVCY